MVTLYRGLLGGLLLVVLAACPAPPPPDVDPRLSISLSPDTVTVQAGDESDEIVVTLTRVPGFDTFVELSVQGLPPGFAASIADPGTGNEGSVVIIVPADAEAATHQLEVVASGNGETARAMLELVVTAEPVDPTFTLSLSPDSVTVPAGEDSEEITATLDRDPGFDTFVELSVQGLPPGFAASIADPGTGDQGSIVIVVPEDAEATTHLLEVIASGNDETATATLEVTVVDEDPVDPGTGAISGTLRTDNDFVQFTVQADPAVDLTTRAPSPDRAEFVPGQVLVEYRDADLFVQELNVGADPTRADLADAVLSDHDLQRIRAGGEGLPDLLAVPPGADVLEVVARLSRDPRVEFAEPNYYLYPQSLPNDPLMAELWHLPVSGVPVAWNETADAGDVVVALVDTGVDVEHEDLQGVFLPGYDFCASPDCASHDSDPRPDSAADVHGTFMAGLIAAVGDNGVGVAGVLHAGANVVPVKTFYDGDVITVEAAARAIRWAAGLTVTEVASNANPADVISMSFGSETDASTLRSAVEAAQGEGALLISAVGNAGVDGVLYPARYSGVIGVGSVNSSFTRSCFSNYGTGLDIMAAGGEYPVTGCDEGDERLLSTQPSNQYGYMAGTSQATAIVSGAAALVWSQQTSPTAASVRDVLLDNAYFDGSVMDGRYGTGILRLDDALDLLGPAGGRFVEASVIAESDTDSGVATATLDLLHGDSDTFTISGLEAGSYTVDADAFRNGASLSGSTSVTVSEDETSSTTVRLGP